VNSRKDASRNPEEKPPKKRNRRSDQTLSSAEWDTGPRSPPGDLKKKEDLKSKRKREIDPAIRLQETLLGEGARSQS